MSLLRFASLVILSIWIGGLAVLGGIVAPAAFAMLDRSAAGALFGEMFVRFQRLSWILGALLLAILATRAALGPRPRQFWTRLWTVVGMLAISLIIGFGLAPRINAMRESSPGAVAERNASDPVRIQFDRLHGLANGLMILTLVAGLGVMWLEAEDRH